MKKDLTIINNDITKEITDLKGRFSSIITKAADNNAISFRTINEKSLAKINEFMPEVNRAVTICGRSDSQTSASLMTLNMISAGPYRVLRQILAQIEKKRSALKENIYNMEEKKLEYRMLEEQMANLNGEILLENGDKAMTAAISKPSEKELDIRREQTQLKMDKIASDIVDVIVPIEQAIKNIGSYVERYEEVRKNNNIPDNWDEVDFEEAEIEHHIKSMFRNAIKDRMAGQFNQGTMEYFEQYGIEPVLAYRLVDNFISKIRNGMENKGAPSIEIRYAFYDEMYETFKDEYKKAMKRIGLDSITQADWLMKENK